MENKELEEAAENYSISKSSSPVFKEAHKKDFIVGAEWGAKWQAERMYSEEEIARAFNEGMAYETMGKYIKGEEWVKTHKKEWFEQVKKTKHGI